ncbi:quinone oxidoreductase family protein [Actinacidiphila acididurans]|uniref:Quinone oxidoreductase n=1 Tax=Actinacidiphila acididurans TaxID=2784346 RepID=A0ABS2TIB5_9ACTN|nr:quinone oxidoreductase [Actinacidiphila acididurans]MBM9503087.1 quinone oxidoreductase [Actinacidiphila acididurans]
MRRIELDHTGGPDVLTLVERETPVPGPGELLVRIAAAGVNYLDVDHRRGSFPVELPYALGGEAAGTVTAVGDGVRQYAPGDRIAWFGLSGSYADEAIVPAASAVAVPDDITDETAAAAMLQGVTAHYLACSTWPVRPGQTALVHAAAGGVGQLLTQIIKLRGGRVIATVSTEEKAAIARANGSDHVINYSTADFAAATLELLGGRGVDVVYDGVGKDTFAGGLQVLRPRGMLIQYGTSSGPVPPFNLMELNTNGSLFVTNPNPPSYLQTPDEFAGRVKDLFTWISTGELEVSIGARYPLEQVARAHDDLQNRRTTGKLLLIP